MREESNMIRLIADRTTQTATIPLRWCITPQCLEKLREMGVVNPFVLVVVVSGNGKWDSLESREDRYIVPLGRMMEFIPVHRPGISKIFAAIVWDEEDGKAGLKQRYLTKERGRYETSVLRYDKEDSFREMMSNFMGSDMVELQVPEWMFAKKRWDSWWVNLFFESKPVDDCHFRKRRMFAYTAQPLILSVWLPFRIAAGFVVAFFHTILLARPDVNWKAAFVPFRYQMGDICLNAEDPVTLFEFAIVDGKLRKEEEGIEFGKDIVIFSGWGLTPIWPTILLGVCSIPSLLRAVVFKNALTAALAVVVIVLGTSLFFTIISLGTIAIRRWKERQPLPAPAPSATEAEQKFKELEPLLCATGLAARLDALPRQRRTIRLRFMDLKRKVCRPFAL